MQPTLLAIGLTFMAAAVAGGGLKLAGIEIPLISSTIRQAMLFLIGFITTVSDRHVRLSLGSIWRRQAVMVALVGVLGVLVGVEGTLWFQTFADSRARRAEARATKAESRAAESERQLQQVLHGQSASMTPTSGSPPTSEPPPPSTNQQFIADLVPVEGKDSVTSGTWTMNISSYPHSVGVPGFCESLSVSYNLDRKYRLFQATVGMTNDALSGSRLRFVVFLDEKEVTRQIADLASPQPIQADVSNGFRLRLMVENPDTLFCTHTTAVWGEARLSP